MITVVIQARLGSSRLPGKTLADIAGRPMLDHVVERAKAIPGVDNLVLAIADGSANEPIVDFARASGLRWARGSETDVLDRTYQTARAFPTNAIVRISPDCPLLDPHVSGLVVARYRSLGDSVDYVSNVHPPTFPDGLDTEVFSREALEVAWRETRKDPERLSDLEHVTPFIWRQPERFRLDNVTNARNLSTQRWTVDTAGDLEFVRAVYAALGGSGRIFGVGDVLRLLESRPDLSRINAGQRRNEGFEKSLAADAAPRLGR